MFHLNVQSGEISNGDLFKILHINTQCLRNKTGQLEANNLNYDILVFSEHWMSDIELGQTKLHNFTLLSYYCRRHHIHGGVAAAVRDALVKEFHPREDLNALSIEMQIELCAIQSTTLNIIIITLYRPPQGNFTVFLDTMSNILQFISKMKYQIFILGDFNIDFNKSSIYRSDTLDLFNSYGLTNIITKNTRGSACLDNIFTNVSDCEEHVFDLGFSDHLAVGTGFINHSQAPMKVVSTLHKPITENGLNLITSLVQDVCWEFIDNENIGIDMKFEMFVTLIKNCMDLAFPEKKI